MPSFPLLPCAQILLQCAYFHCHIHSLLLENLLLLLKLTEQSSYMASPLPFFVQWLPDFLEIKVLPPSAHPPAEPGPLSDWAGPSPLGDLSSWNPFYVLST
jgi:hypothetical protein